MPFLYVDVRNRLMQLITSIMAQEVNMQANGMSGHRQSEIELLRIVAMLMVLLLHVNFLTFGEPDAQSVNIAPINSFLRIFAEHLCIVAVNVYVLISGWFGIRPKTKSVTNLLIQVLSYSIIGLLVCLLIGKNTLSRVMIYDIIIIGKGYWFVVSYLLLYVLAPVLNAFVEKSSASQIRILLISFFTFEFIYGWYAGQGGFGSGYSTLSFIGLYILARYIRMYGCRIDNYSMTKCWTIYFCISLFMTTYVYLQLVILGRVFTTGNYLISYNCPLVILSSLFLFFAFQKLRITNRFINYWSRSAFAIYLIHCNTHILPYFQGGAESIYDSFGLSGILLYVLLVMTACLLIDKIREFILPIEAICIRTERMVQRVSSYFKIKV